MTAPSLKDFKNMVTFLFQQLDPNFEFSTEFTEDIKDVLKIMGYPFTISKSSLSAVGSPHTWPPILAMLVWVIEQLNYLEMLDEEEDKNIQTDEGKMFFEFLTTAYKNFMDGEDSFENLVDELKVSFDERTAAAEEEYEKFKESNEALQVELDAISQDSNTVSGLQAKREDYLSDMAKFEKLNIKLEKHMETTLKKKDAIEAELKELEQQMTAAANEQEELKETIESQPLSKAEVKRINQETQLKQDNIDAQLKQKQEIERGIWDAEMLQCKIIGTVEDMVRSYNSLCNELQNGENKKNNGLELNITFQPHAEDIKEMISRDLTHSVKPTLNKMDEKYKAMVRALETQLRDVKQELMRTADMKAEAIAKVQQCEQRLEKIHEAYRTERDEMNKQAAESLNSLEEIELHIHRTKTVLSQELRESEQKVREIDEHMKVLQNQQSSIEHKARNTITEMAEKLAEHRAWVVETITETSDKVIAIKAEVEDTCAETL